MANNFSQLLIGVCALALATGCQQQDDPAAVATVATANSPTSSTESTPSAAPAPNDSGVMKQFVPAWVADAVFYQIFPERFRNGDRSNDPTRESLEFPNNVSKKWAVSPWTGDWYARADWERERGESFYDNGVFDRRYGGDLQGVIDKLDYLVELGINAIYFNPMFYARSLHKYDGTSMHHIDPYFGPDPVGDLKLLAAETNDPTTWQWTAADKQFLELVEFAHQRGIRVIVDGVFNHTGRDFWAFADIREKQAASPYKDWYIVQHFDDPTTPQNEFKYKSWWGFETLPEFANNAAGDDLHPEPKQYLMDITRRWMDPNGDGDLSDGIDGWRLDVANEVPMGFWRDWNELVRQLNPEAYTVGEFWDNARDQLIEGRFSGTMNYHNFAYLVKGFLIDGKLTPHDFGKELESRRKRFPEVMQFALQNLIDSHDTDRVASMIVNAGREETYLQPDRFDFDVSERVSPRNDKTYQVRKPNARERRIQRLVALMQMTYVGPPMIYYGTEAGMWGGDDPDDRMPMVWEDLQYDDQAADPLGRPRESDSVAFDRALFAFYRDVIQLRRDTPALRRGTVELLDHDDQAKFFAFRRELDGESVVIAINRGDAEFVWNYTPRNINSLESLFLGADSNEQVTIDDSAGELVATFPALSAAVLAENSPHNADAE